MAGRSRTKLDCLEVLTGAEASAILRHLLSSYPELISDARQAANALLATVSFTEIARSVFEALIALDLDDLDAGPRAAGYVEPSEAAGAVIENVTEPYFRDLERRVKLRHEDEATALCKGIVLGLLWRELLNKGTRKRNVAAPTLPDRNRLTGKFGRAILCIFKELEAPLFGTIEWHWLAR